MRVVSHNNAALSPSALEDLPIDELFVLPGMMAGKQVTVLKDDGCNTNILSTDFVRRNRHLLQTAKRNTVIKHSDKETTQRSNIVVLNATLNIDSHLYTSNWVVANSRYDVILGIPWHVTYNPIINYTKHTVSVNGSSLPTVRDNNDKPRISNISVKRFRSLIRASKKRDDVTIFQLVNTSAQFDNSTEPHTLDSISKHASFPEKLHGHLQTLLQN